MQDSNHLGERIAAIEAQIAELGAREDRAAEDRERKWDALTSIRDEVKTVSAQQTLMNSRIEAIGQMAQVAKDFVAAAREIPTRTDFNALKEESHATNLRLAELQTEFKIVKAQRDVSASRMWTMISGSFLAGISALLGLVATWLTKH